MYGFKVKNTQRKMSNINQMENYLKDIFKMLEIEDREK